MPLGSSASPPPLLSPILSLITSSSPLPPPVPALRPRIFTTRLYTRHCCEDFNHTLTMAPARPALFPNQSQFNLCKNSILYKHLFSYLFNPITITLYLPKSYQYSTHANAPSRPCSPFTPNKHTFSYKNHTRAATFERQHLSRQSHRTTGLFQSSSDSQPEPLP